MRGFTTRALLFLFLLALTFPGSNPMTTSGQPSAMAINTFLQDCPSLSGGFVGCILGCCRSVAVGIDCDGNVCTVTFEVCQSGVAFLTFEGDCGDIGGIS